MIDLNFTYDGVTSQAMGLHNIRLDSGLFPIPVAGGKDIVEDQIPRQTSPVFYRTKYQPISFKLSFASLDSDLTPEKIQTISKWLFTNTYREMVFSENTNKTMYCMPTNQIDFMTNGLSQGYFECQFRCRDSHFWTASATPTFNLLTSATPTIIEITNASNIGLNYYHPIIEIQLESNSTSFSIKNKSDNDRIFSFSGLNAGETIYIDNNKKQIISSSGLYRYSSWNKNWLRLVYGLNQLEVTGKCRVSFDLRFPVFT